VNPIRIGCIVEGRGDVQAVATVVQRIAQIEVPSTVVITNDVKTLDRGLMVQPQRLGADVALVARRLGGHGGILIVLDADDDCPATLGPTLQASAQAIRRDIPVGVVLATREFEAWFLAAAESLRGLRNLSHTLDSHPHPESVRDAKGWLTSQMPRPKTYSASVDQVHLARAFDMSLARSRSDSFDKCYREITRLLKMLG
jgi:hypothetical protein